MGEGDELLTYDWDGREGRRRKVLGEMEAENKTGNGLVMINSPFRGVGWGPKVVDNISTKCLLAKFPELQVETLSVLNF